MIWQTFKLWRAHRKLQKALHKLSDTQLRVRYCSGQVNITKEKLIVQL